MSLHFIRPWWLLALLPLLALLWWLYRHRSSRGAWNAYIAPHLAAVLLSGTNSARPKGIGILGAAWLVAVLALSGPAVQKQALPVFATDAGRVLLMDMSLSMYATDLAPNRLTQAKFRATDLIRSLSEGETGLVAYAGDAFTIAPLTRDSNTLLNLLPTLSPDIMPVRGSSLSQGVRRAMDLLKQGGHLKGDILLLTDGISDTEYRDTSELLDGGQYRLSILAFGTPQGAPIRLPDGNLLRDSGNELIIVKTDLARLADLARKGDGMALAARNDGSELPLLLNWLERGTDAKATELTGDSWQDLGPYIALLLLLPVLLSFRFGMPAAVLLACILPLGKSQAALFQTRDQQAMEAFKQGEFQQAANSFTLPTWRGAAHYRAGDYESALKDFEQDDSAMGLYNQGNSLMQLGQYQEAEKRYQQALEKQPDLDAAKANAKLAEQLAKQPPQQQSGSGSDQGQSGDNDANGQQGQSGDNSANDDQQGQESQGSQQNGQGSGNQNPEQQESSSDNQGAGDDAAANDNPPQDGQEGQQQAESEQNSGQGNSGSSQNNDAQMQADPKAADKQQQAGTQAAGTQAGVDEGEPEKAQSATQAMAGADKAPEDGEEATALTATEQPGQMSPQTERALRVINDDPSVLLRNKMQLEYQLRRARGEHRKEKEQW
ncbi:vWA domain-containing protein [Shewanella cyperi]|uniref:vWA domain-containing protein n=1 Tax=Shewanella cyperi TaxID=2814292 RepID=UPI001A93E205|nr:VWA domain-containing protein [Shewanella cyperi]QSX39582.1 VWA domain-containing protein [Shewanella cyperi]